MPRKPASPPSTAAAQRVAPPQMEKAIASTKLTERQKLDALPAIHITETTLSENVDAALQALGESTKYEVFNHGGQLKELVRTVDARGTAHVLTPLSFSRARVMLTNCCVCTVPSPKQDFTTGRFAKIVLAPEALTNAMLEDPYLPGVRRLDRVLSSPSIHRDGTVFTKPGYHPEFCLYLTGTLPELERLPILSREEASAVFDSVATELFGEFKFTEECAKFGKHTAMSMLLTAVASPGLDMKAPASAISAVGQGAGKSTLVDTIAHVATGRAFPSISLPSKSKDPKTLGDHMKVQIESFVSQGEPFLHVSNWPSGFPFGDANTTKSITSPTTSIRPYGRNDVMRHYPERLVWFIDGNNFTLTREVELERRLLLLQLVPQPGRTFTLGDTSSVCAYIIANRARLLSQCLQVLRSFILSPEFASPEKLRNGRASFASFGVWDHYIRCCLLWLGKEDPLQANNLAHSVYSDKAEGNLIAFLREWWSMHGSTPITLRELMLPPSGKSQTDVDHLLRALYNFSETSVDTDRGVLIGVKAKRLDAALDRYDGRPTGLGPFLLKRGGVKRHNATVWCLGVQEGKEADAALRPDENVDIQKETPVPNNVIQMRDTPF